MATDKNTVITDGKAICDELNNFFVNIGPQMAKKIPIHSKTDATNLTHSCLNSFFCEPIVTEEVLHEKN